MKSVLFIVIISILSVNCTSNNEDGEPSTKEPKLKQDIVLDFSNLQDFKSQARPGRSFNRFFEKLMDLTLTTTDHNRMISNKLNSILEISNEMIEKLSENVLANIVPQLESLEKKNQELNQMTSLATKEMIFLIKWIEERVEYVMYDYGKLSLITIRNDLFCSKAFTEVVAGILSQKLLQINHLIKKIGGVKRDEIIKVIQELKQELDPKKFIEMTKNISINIKELNGISASKERIERMVPYHEYLKNHCN